VSVTELLLCRIASGGGPKNRKVGLQWTKLLQQ